MDWLGWIIALVLVVMVINARQELLKEQGRADGKADTKKDYSQSYQRKHLLTKNEYREYMKLRQYAADRGLLICPKVRLLDIIEPRKGEKDYKSLFYKVQAKHVDFVICDQDLRIKAVLELDDSSHDQKDRKERDAFVDQILTSVGYKVIHVRSIADTTLDGLGTDHKTADKEMTPPASGRKPATTPEKT